MAIIAPRLFLVAKTPRQPAGPSGSSPPMAGTAAPRARDVIAMSVVARRMIAGTSFRSSRTVTHHAHRVAVRSDAERCKVMSGKSDHDIETTARRTRAMTGHMRGRYPKAVLAFRSKRNKGNR